MPKRFTETDKWKDVWFRKLSPNDKLVFFYLVENCDNAGFIELDTDMAAFVIGLSDEDIKSSIKGLARALLGPREGLYYVKNFLIHQKNHPLNPSNRAHSQIIGLVGSKANIFPEVYQFAINSIPMEGASKGLVSPTGIGKGNGLSNNPSNNPSNELDPEAAKFSKFESRAACSPRDVQAILIQLRQIPDELYEKFLLRCDDIQDGLTEKAYSRMGALKLIPTAMQSLDQPKKKLEGAAATAEYLKQWIGEGNE